MLTFASTMRSIVAHDMCSEFGAGFGVVLAYFVLPTPPAQYRIVWVIEPFIYGTGQSFFRVFFFVVPIPPRSEPRVI